MEPLLPRERDERGWMGFECDGLTKEREWEGERMGGRKNEKDEE